VCLRLSLVLKRLVEPNQMPTARGIGNLETLDDFALNGKVCAEIVGSFFVAQLDDGAGKARCR
jgi:hypothetical protein